MSAQSAIRAARDSGHLIRCLHSSVAAIYDRRRLFVHRLPTVIDRRYRRRCLREQLFEFLGREPGHERFLAVDGGVDRRPLFLLQPQDFFFDGVAGD
jgi:hypothetical protein